MQKCGMEFEGISKQAKKIKGVFRDVIRYGITKENYKSINIS
jgi:RimJ/RimL family protein N-acetyltransferase